MNNKFKFLSVLLVIALTIGALAPLTALRAEEEKVTQSVTLHKILQTKEAMNAKDGEQKDVFPGTKGIDGVEYNGNQITSIKGYFGEDSNQIEGVYFAIKFDEDFEIPENNTTVVKEDVKSGKAYVKADASRTDKLVPATPLTSTTNIEEAVGGKTTADGIRFTTSTLKGKFKIDEITEKSTYIGVGGAEITGNKAVPVEITLPLVNNDGVVENAHVYPKNIEEKPEIDKNFAVNHGLDKYLDNGGNMDVGANFDNYNKEKATATASIGKIVPYEVKTRIPQNAKYKKLVWNDTMSEGLTYKKDLEIKIDGVELVKGTDYDLIEDDRGFQLKLKRSNDENTKLGIEKIEEAAKKKEIVITLKYSATVNSEAVVDDPQNNNITLDYSNKPGKDSDPIEGKPLDKEIKVEKSWTKGADAISGNLNKEVTVVYTLQEKNGQVWTNKETKIIRSNNTNEFSYTFKNLDDNKTYRVIERVSGYEAEYVSFQGGKTVLKNNKKPEDPTPLEPTEPKVINGGKKFVKTSENKEERLAGAEFYVKNADGKYLVAKATNPGAVTDAKAELDAKVKAYNELSAEDQKGQKGEEAKKAIDKAQEAYNKAFIENAEAYTFEDENTNAVVLTSDAQGRFEIKGLAYGKYKLEEKTAPKGFAKLSGDIEFTVAKETYAGTNAELQYNLANADNGYGQQVKNKKVSIPQTGGIGTIIFTVGGLALMAGAAFALKKSKEDELEGLA